MTKLAFLVSLVAVSAQAATYNTPSIDIFMPAATTQTHTLTFTISRQADDPETTPNEVELITFQTVEGSESWILPGQSTLVLGEITDDTLEMIVRFRVAENTSGLRRSGQLNVNFQAQLPGESAVVGVGSISIVQSEGGQPIDTVSENLFDGQIFGLGADTDVFFSPWFGSFSAPTEFNGWIFSFQHQEFFFPSGAEVQVGADRIATFWAFDNTMKSWLWFSEDFYDVSTFENAGSKVALFNATQSQWTQYSKVDVDPRWFFLVDDNEWKNEFELAPQT